MSKRVKKVEEATYKGTDEVYVTTEDGWIYVFTRPDESDPYRFNRKRTPDAEISKTKSRTPKNVVEYMERAYDTAELHPQKVRSKSQW